MHKSLFPEAEIVGVDMDEKLLDYAKELGNEGKEKGGRKEGRGISQGI